MPVTQLVVYLSQALLFGLLLLLLPAVTFGLGLLVALGLHLLLALDFDLAGAFGLYLLLLFNAYLVLTLLQVAPVLDVVGEGVAGTVALGQGLARYG